MYGIPPWGMPHASGIRVGLFPLAYIPNGVGAPHNLVVTFGFYCGNSIAATGPVCRGSPYPMDRRFMPI